MTQTLQNIYKLPHLKIDEQIYTYSSGDKKETDILSFEMELPNSAQKIRVTWEKTKNKTRSTVDVVGFKTLQSDFRNELKTVWEQSLQEVGLDQKNIQFYLDLIQKARPILQAEYQGFKISKKPSDTVFDIRQQIFVESLSTLTFDGQSIIKPPHRVVFFGFDTNEWRLVLIDFFKLKGIDVSQLVNECVFNEKIELKNLPKILNPSPP